MNFTQEQISTLIDEITKKENGYFSAIKMVLESIMRAERNEFNKQESDSSNGYRFSSVFAHGGQLQLVVPRSRSSNFYPLILAVIKDQDNESKKLAYELYQAGLTTLQVGDLFEKIYGKHYSKSAISSMMNYARTDVDAWLGRKLEKRYPIIYIDATYWHTRRDKNVSKEAYYTVLAVKEDRTREVLAIVNHPTEGASNWQEVFESLKKRGVEEINLMVSDGLQGIEDAFKSVFPMADIQLCTVHLARNIQAKVKPEDKAEVAAGLKQVLDPTNKEDTQATGHKRFSEFIDKWIKKYPSFKCYKEPRYYSYFSYLNYHVEVRRMIYTTNWIERLNRSYKRTLRMRTSMPSPESVVFLIGSVACNRKEFNYPITQFIHEPKLFKN
jgi:putative transposase